MQRITDEGWLFIPGVYKMQTATDVLNRAINKTIEVNGMYQRRIEIATTLREPDSVNDLNTAVRDLRELGYQFRIEAQAAGILLGMSNIYEGGQFNLKPENCHVDKLKLMVKGLQQSLADMVDDTEAAFKVHT